MDSSDEDIYITQNRFCQESVLPNIDFDSLDEVLGNVELEAENENLIESDLQSKTNVELKCSKVSRGISLVDDNELERRKLTRIPQSTKINTNWAVRTWSEWAEERNKLHDVGAREEMHLLVSPEILHLDKDELNYWMSNMVVEVRKKKEPGSVYPPNSLYQLCCGLQRFLRDNGWPELNLFTEPTFKHFQDCLDAEMKRLTRIGVGSNVKEAQPFSNEDENKLWDLGLLGDDSGKVLVDTMVFLIGKNFALRSGKEHRGLRFSQFTLVEANDKEPEKLIYTSFGEKNNPGGLKHRALRQKKIEHYASETRPERCLVNLYKKYVSKCPQSAFTKDVFYLSPRRQYKMSDSGKCYSITLLTQNKLFWTLYILLVFAIMAMTLYNFLSYFMVFIEWFGSVPVGHNVLGNTVKRLCKEGKIDGQFSNHSLRATTATRALEKGIPDKFVMERTGHRDVRSLQKYQRPNISTKIDISRAFESDVNAKKVLKEEENDSNVNAQKSVKRVGNECDDYLENPCKVQKVRQRAEEKNSAVFNNCNFFIHKDFNI